MTAISEAPASAAATAISNTAQTNSAPFSIQTTTAPSSSQITGSLSPTRVIVVTSVLNQHGEETVTSIPNNNNTDSHTSNLGAVIGGITAGVVALIAIAALAFLFLRRRRRRNQPQVPRKFSLKENLDLMYKDRRSLKSLFKSDTPSELIGSVPDLNAPISEKDWEKRYESPGDVGKFKLLNPQRSSRDLSLVSPLSQNFRDDHSDPAELPAQGNAKTITVHEMPERSNTRKPAKLP